MLPQPILDARASRLRCSCSFRRRTGSCRGLACHSAMWRYQPP
jgi:hypothetical protein